MENPKKSRYRINPVVRNSFYGNKVEIHYFIQKRNFFGWWNLSDEITDENEAKRMLEKLNKYDEFINKKI